MNPTQIGIVAFAGGVLVGMAVVDAVAGLVVIGLGAVMLIMVTWMGRDRSRRHRGQSVREYLIGRPDDDADR
jgi:hypothetical protein